MLPLIHYWHEPNPPDDVVETLASLEARNPNLEQRVFDQSSAAELIATHFGARELAAFRGCAVPAMQADYVRYCAVYVLGGVYADANFHCGGNLERLIEGHGRGVLFGRQDPVPSDLAALYKWPHPIGPFRAVTNGMFGFVSGGDPLLGLAVQVATTNIENRVADGPIGVWVTTGPGIFTSLYLLHELGSVDAFIEYAAGSVIEPSAALLCEVVGDYGGVAELWEGVSILPLSERDEWGVKVAGRSQRTSWARAQGSIYGGLA